MSKHKVGKKNVKDNISKVKPTTVIVGAVYIAGSLIAVATWIYFANKVID